MSESSLVAECVGLSVAPALAVVALLLVAPRLDTSKESALASEKSGPAVSEPGESLSSKLRVVNGARSSHPLEVGASVGRRIQVVIVGRSLSGVGASIVVANGAWSCWVS